MSEIEREDTVVKLRQPISSGGTASITKFLQMGLQALQYCNIVVLPS